MPRRKYRVKDVDKFSGERVRKYRRIMSECISFYPGFTQKQVREDINNIAKCGITGESLLENFTKGALIQLRHRGIWG